MRAEVLNLSVILITKNEAENIRACLESVGWADEIVVVDSGSTDETVEIAREFTGKVYLHPDWPGFGPQKNRALDYATGDWVLSIDADERVTPELRGEIEHELSSPQADAYRIPRLSSFCGRFMRLPVGGRIMCCVCFGVIWVDSVRRRYMNPWRSVAK